jgi:hypothetical protein
MPPGSTLSDVAHVIQLSVAPVFLLTSVGTFLAVLSTRLSRIVDRARVLEARAETLGGAARESLRGELRLLGRRRHLVHVAMTAGVCAAIFVCLLIASAFIGSLLGLNWWVFVAVLFIAAMIAFVIALVVFLREVLLAVASVKLEPE